MAKRTKKLPRYNGDNKMVDAYTQDGWEWLKCCSGLLSRAAAMVSEDARQLDDVGTCVLGAGVYVWRVYPRRRRPERYLVLGAPFQGNLSTQRATRRAMEYLQSEGVDCWYYDGVMD